MQSLKLEARILIVAGLRTLPFSEGSQRVLAVYLFFSVAAEVGQVVSNSQEATLAMAMLARYGECGIRRIRDSLVEVPVLPNSLESTRGPVPDVLPLRPCLVDCWTAEKKVSEGSVRRGRRATVVRSMCDSLNFLFCAGFADKPIVPDSVRPLRRRPVEMLECLWQVASEFLSVKAVPFCLSAVQAAIISLSVDDSAGNGCLREYQCIGELFSIATKPDCDL